MWELLPVAWSGCCSNFHVLKCIFLKYIFSKVSSAWNDKSHHRTDTWTWYQGLGWGATLLLWVHGAAVVDLSICGRRCFDVLLCAEVMRAYPHACIRVCLRVYCVEGTARRTLVWTNIHICEYRPYVCTAFKRAARAIYSQICVNVLKSQTPTLTPTHIHLYIPWQTYIHVHKREYIRIDIWSHTKLWH